MASSVPPHPPPPATCSGAPSCLPRSGLPISRVGCVLTAPGFSATVNMRLGTDAAITREAMVVNAIVTPYT